MKEREQLLRQIDADDTEKLLLQEENEHLHQQIKVLLLALEKIQSYGPGHELGSLAIWHTARQAIASVALSPNQTKPNSVFVDAARNRD